MRPDICCVQISGLISYCSLVPRSTIKSATGSFPGCMASQQVSGCCVNCNSYYFLGAYELQLLLKNLIE